MLVLFFFSTTNKVSAEQVWPENLQYLQGTEILESLAGSWQALLQIMKKLEFIHMFDDDVEAATFQLPAVIKRACITRNILYLFHRLAGQCDAGGDFALY